MQNPSNPFDLGPVSTSAGNLSYDDYLRQFYGNDPASLIPQTPGGNDWQYPSNDFGGFLSVGDDLKTGTELPGSGAPFGSTFPGSGGMFSAGPKPTSPFAGLGDTLNSSGKSWADFGYQGVGPGGPGGGGGFDPWAGNPFAGAMAQGMWQGFLNNGQVAGQTSDAIWQTMQFNQQNKQFNDLYGSQYDIKLRDLDNQKAALDAQIAALTAQNDLASQKMANELKMFSDQLEAQKAQYEAQIAFQNAQLAQQGQLGNRQIDVQDTQAQAQLQAMLAQMQQQYDLGMRGLDIQADQGGSAADQLALQKWMFQQTQSQADKDRQMKLDLFGQLAGMFGGGTGGVGGIGGGTESGGSTGGSGGIGFTGPQGQYAGIQTNTGITAGGLNPGTIRAGVSAIEGSGAENVAGPTGGMTGAQRQALGQDFGAMNYAGGQMAATDALRSLMPQNAELSLSADRARQGMNQDYAAFVAQQERNRMGEGLAQKGNLFQMLQSLMV